jgi:hypothetical protein
MVNLPSYSVLVAVDEQHLKEWLEVLPTWKKHRAEMCERPLLLVCDRARPDYGAWPGDSEIMDWGNPISKKPQRDRMLEGLVEGARQASCKADYILKLDADCVAFPAANWVLPEWFTDRPAIIASPWGYTKPADALERFDAWARENGIPGDPLAIPGNPGSTLVRHPRITGWCMWIRSDFARQAGQYVAQFGMPWPSQDGYHWALAKRLGEKIVTARMTNYGWRHCPHPRNRAAAVAESMANIT